MPDETLSLQTLTAEALQRPSAQPVVEYRGEWRTWGEIRHVAERLAALIDASGAPTQAPIAFVARNRPSAIAALLGLIAQGRSICMLYAYQAGAALARDVERLKPALLVAAREDFSDELSAVLRAEGAGHSLTVSLPAAYRARDSAAKPALPVAASPITQHCVPAGSCARI